MTDRIPKRHGRTEEDSTVCRRNVDHVVDVVEEEAVKDGMRLRDRFVVITNGRLDGW